MCTYLLGLDPSMVWGKGSLLRTCELNSCRLCDIAALRRPQRMLSAWREQDWRLPSASSRSASPTRLQPPTSSALPETSPPAPGASASGASCTLHSDWMPAWSRSAGLNVCLSCLSAKSLARSKLPALHAQSRRHHCLQLAPAEDLDGAHRLLSRPLPSDRSARGLCH